MPIGDAAASIVAADFDADGFIDLAASNGPEDRIAFIFGNGSGQFSDPLEFKESILQGTMVAHDFDGNGFV